MSKRLAATCLCALALLQPGARARPYTPGSGGLVIERLARRADPLQQELHGLRAQLSAAPNDLALAARLAGRYIETARSLADPRYLGYAQAALAPWWRLAAPPPQARLLRATLLQSAHHFPEALADLDAVVAVDPGNAQAWLTRATVQTVRGDYNAATASCARLSRLASDLVAITCIANVAAMTGRAAASEVLLETTLRRSGEREPEVRLWALTLLAEIAGRRGETALAEARYRAALAIKAHDSYLLGAYADFLLEQKRPREVVKLVADSTRIDALLLRHALALQQLPGSEAEAALRASSAELRARFDAAGERGDKLLHQREQARFELHLRGDSKNALALARQNWAVQKELADMRIVLEAAVAARDRGAAAPVLDWVRKHGVEDTVVARLARELARAP